MKTWFCLLKAMNHFLVSLQSSPMVFRPMTRSTVFSILEPDLLRQCLNEHGKGILDSLSKKQICLDAKKLKETSPSNRGNQGLYIVTAQVAENRLCIGLQRVDNNTICAKFAHFYNYCDLRILNSLKFNFAYVFKGKSRLLFIVLIFNNR